MKVDAISSMGQHALILKWLAAQCCEHHAHDQSGQNECGFCQKYLRYLYEVMEYGRSGHLPFGVLMKIQRDQTNG
jgi:hypothetical protein